MRIPAYVQTFMLTTALLASPAAVSQDVPTRATHEEIDHWLRSRDSRLIAWGATFADKDADTDSLPVLEGLAERYISLPPQPYDEHGNYVPRTSEQKEQLDSMQAVLDGLIRLHGTISSEGVDALLADFPAQSLVLFAMMPEPERSRYALDLYGSRDRSDQPYDWHRLAHQQMIHMAAAILALAPPPGFTATLLNETTVHVKVAVTDDDQVRDGGFGVGACGDSFALAAAPGWPQPHTYVVEQHWPSQGIAEGVLVPGVPAITSRRALSSSSCSTLSGFTSVQKLLLAQQEAGQPSEGRRLGTFQYDTLRYSDPAHFSASLANLIARDQAPFQELASALIRKGLITSAEAESAMPEFVVEIDDQRSVKTQPLPITVSLGPRIIVGPLRAESGAFARQE